MNELKLNKLNKLKMQTANITDENIEKLAKLFPNIISEKKDGNTVKKAVDFDLLKQILSENIVEGDDERYRLDWPGKKASLLKANTPIKKTLRPSIEESKDFENTQNLYIEGDNFEVLKLLQESYLNKIKMIYIDPPYNTGKDFVYKDNFKESKENFEEKIGLKDEEENKLFKNTDSNGRFHSDWLSMMYERLLVSRNLLKDDGVIFISIDDNEVHNLRKICDEVFGEGNFVSQIPWQARQSIQNDTDLSSSHEYIVSYAKIRRQTNRRLKEVNKELWFKEKSFACYPIPLDKGKFANPDNDSRGIWKADPFDAPNIRPNLTYPIINPNTNEIHMPPNGRCWRTEEKNYKEWLSDKRIVFGKTGDGRPQLKVFYEEKKEFGSVPNTWFDGNSYGTATKGTKLLQSLFNSSPFDTPKPIKLIQQLMILSTKKDDLILDFFSGSATTAHAVIDLNAQDIGNRKYIMVQLSEVTDEKSEAFKAGYKTIPEIGKERIRRAGEKIIEDNKDKENIKNLDIGFRVLKTDSSNFKDVYYHPNDLGQKDLFNLESNIKEDRDELDLLFQIMLDLGIELDLKITKEIVDDKTIFILENSELVACFSQNISLEVIEKIKAHNPYKVVLKDGCFANDTDKINAIQDLSQNSSVSVI
ncbi:site-specific DNA-methyltransferase [Poseidonibacter antarcticus]|uniref:site-specific DNA-methyltransferase n=1 Tax=Poseidonibacter antarcticus TaxID=2478538 RepID=UPI0019692FEA|nr:site-specific DNA-methyltransferase [Poseidonibacter antarcticus]